MEWIIYDVPRLVFHLSGYHGYFAAFELIEQSLQTTLHNSVLGLYYSFNYNYGVIGHFL